MRKVTILLLGAGILLSLAGCQKGSETDNGGKSVQFNVVSGIPSTRTEYSGDGEWTGEGDARRLVWERINWKEGDEVTIWSDYATDRINHSKKYATYKVGAPSVINDNKESKAPISDWDGEGLTYDDSQKDVTYTFWGAYPALSGVPSNGQATFSIPTPQTGTASGTGDIVLTPDMSKAVMFGTQTAKYNENFDLYFYPAYTAFEIVIKAAESATAPIEVTSVDLISTTALYGSDITATIKSGTATNSKGKTMGASTYSTVAATDANKVLTYNFPEGTAVNNTNTLTFTVFAVPQDIVGLTLAFTLADGTVRTAKLSQSGSAITFGACEKHRIYTLAIPEGNWHLYLEANVKDWIDEAASQTYGESGEDDKGVIVSAAALEFVAGVASRTGRTSATMEGSGEDSPLKAYFSVFSPTNGTWRITLSGDDADKFTLSSDNANENTATVTGAGYIEGNINAGEKDDSRILFSLVASGSGTVQLSFSVVVDGVEYSLHSEVTRDASSPLTVTCP